MKILFTGPTPHWVLQEVTGLGHDITSVAEDFYVNEEKFCKDIPAFDIYVCGGLEICTAQVIEAGKNLKAILFLGVDYSAYIDVQAANKNKIPIYGTPGANAQAVAEWTMNLIFAAARKLPVIALHMNERKWKAQTGFELQGKRLGLLGSGNIAQATARMGTALGMKVSYWSRSGANPKMTGSYATFDEVLSTSDILSLHLPGAAGKIIGAQEISKMKKGAALINTARALLVDSEALHHALISEHLSYAAFDVFYAEGEKAWSCPEASLLSLGPDRFFLSPHTAWRTEETDNRTFSQILDRIKNLQ